MTSCSAKSKGDSVVQMISDEERREFAVKLASEAQSWRNTFPDGVCDLGDVSAVMQDLCAFVGLRGEVMCSEIFQRFADLVDRPTCRNLSDDEDLFECSECGQRMPTFDGCSDWIPVSYCPVCGREVVGE